MRFDPRFDPLGIKQDAAPDANVGYRFITHKFVHSATRKAKARTHIRLFHEGLT